MVGDKTVDAAKPQFRRNPPLLLRSPSGRDVPDGAAKASESIVAPLKIMLLCPVVMPSAQFHSFCLPKLLVYASNSMPHGSSQHLDESNRHILADLSWAPFPCSFHQQHPPRGKSLDLGWLQTRRSNDASRTRGVHTRARAPENRDDSRQVSFSCFINFLTPQYRSIALLKPSRQSERRLHV